MAVSIFSNCVLLLLLLATVIFQVHGTAEKRSDDSDPLASVVEQLSSRFTQLEAQVQANKNDLDEVQRAVGFWLRLHQSAVTGMGHGQIIKFDNVLFNAGNGYNSLTGTFTAPTSGTYAFYLQTMAHGDDERIELDIMKNGQFLSRAHAGYATNENGSTMVVTHLNQGDIVHVQVNDGSSFWGGVLCTFTGFMVSSQ